MGMYDVINEKQVKCFPWVSLWNNEIHYHGGDLEYYGNGDEVPYKAPHYNYGRNFIILDLNRFVGHWCADYDFILHVIVGGKVKETFENGIGEIDWSINNSVVSYSGELINIKSSDDLMNYIHDQREYWSEWGKIMRKHDELHKQLSTYANGMWVLDNESEEKKYRLKKMEEIIELMDAEEERISGDLNTLEFNHSKKWFLDDASTRDIVNLGDYISAYHTSVKIKHEDDAKTCRDMIMKILSEDSGIYERYIEWQGDDVFIKEFRPTEDQL